MNACKQRYMSLKSLKNTLLIEGSQCPKSAREVSWRRSAINFYEEVLFSRVYSSLDRIYNIIHSMVLERRCYGLTILEMIEIVRWLNGRVTEFIKLQREERNLPFFNLLLRRKGVVKKPRSAIVRYLGTRASSLL
jgi:hypothetical protein